MSPRRAARKGIEHSRRAENQPDGHLYRLTFRSVPHSQVRAAIAAAFEGALQRAVHVTAHDPWHWGGAWAFVRFDEGPVIEDFEATGLRATFDEIERTLEAVRALAPLRSVVPAHELAGAPDGAFESARRAAREELERTRGPHCAGGATLVLAPDRPDARPTLPDTLAKCFPFVVARARSADGAWWLVVPESDEPGAPVLAVVAEPSGPIRSSAPFPWGKFPSLAVSPTGKSAIVTSTLPTTNGSFRPALHCIERDASTRLLAEVRDVGPNALVAVDWVDADRLLVVTERGVALHRSGGARVAFDPCPEGRAVAVTVDGRRALVASANRRTYLFEIGDGTLRCVASFARDGRPRAAGNRLLLEGDERCWEVQP